MRTLFLAREKGRMDIIYILLKLGSSFDQVDYGDKPANPNAYIVRIRKDYDFFLFTNLDKDHITFKKNNKMVGH